MASKLTLFNSEDRRVVLSPESPGLPKGYEPERGFFPCRPTPANIEFVAKLAGKLGLDLQAQTSASGKLVALVQPNTQSDNDGWTAPE